MNRLFMAFALSAALATSACVTPGTVTAPPSITVTQVTATKAMGDAELAYKTVALAAQAAATSGKLKGANAAKVNDLQNRGYNLLVAARQFNKDHNFVSAVANATSALKLFQSAQAIVPAN